MSRSITRSYFNVNNAAFYNHSDAKVDFPHLPARERAKVVVDVRLERPIRQYRPLRSLLTQSK